MSTKAGTSAQGTPAQGPVSEEEIRAVLLQRAPVTTSDLVGNFKARLKTSEVHIMFFGSNFVFFFERLVDVIYIDIYVGYMII